ncbi:hypothetical protein VNO78_15378 [Psophocarpus tetragonolobus]|uniref:Disease resistance protein At4g27190-like leucine-rich repeats domain-containing protein n=1 Tax=Psophocarpus tetragonolobus TaxID=3891 RepID=A0AAN9SEW6_PSOTE
MPLLSCFYPEKYHLECPVLETLHVAYCPHLELFTSQFHDSKKAAVSQIQQPLFSIEKVVPVLKALTLTEKNIMLLSDEHLPKKIRCKLNVLWLVFENDNNLPFDFFHKVPLLEKLGVHSCFGLKEIFPSQKLRVHDGIFTQLKELHLVELDELGSVGLEQPWVNSYAEKLERLHLFKCPRLEELVGSTVSFMNLKGLVVRSCKRMAYLFTFSTATSLVQLETLMIQDCESIKEIIKKEDEDEDSYEITFGRLQTLSLDSLPRLVSFYSGNATLQFSCLQEVIVVECPGMITFSEGNINAPMLYTIQTSTANWNYQFHNDLNTTIQTFFNQQVFYEYSKHWRQVDYDELKGVQHEKPAFSDNLFSSLKRLELDVGSKRDIVIPSHILPYLKTLEELDVRSCDAVQVIFDFDKSEMETKGIVFPLKKLTLKELPNLKCVCNKNPGGTVSFPNLQDVLVINCGSLATLFPSSLANLKALEIIWCKKLVEIVGKEDAMEQGTIEMFKFPCLSKLLLYELPLLSCFYPEKHHLECPVVPKLEELTLNEKNIILLRDADLPQDFLFKLNILDLSFEDNDKKKDTLCFDFLHKAPSLKCLRVRRCYGLKEIFPSEKLQVHDGILARLNELYIDRLQELECIGLEHPWVKPYTEKLQKLKISGCSRLEKVVFCAVSFINLRVESECVPKDGVFIQLSDCQKFGNAILQLLQFQTGRVVECPNMRTFSQAGINAPMFYGIKTSMDKSDILFEFHNDLNTTIKRFFHQCIWNKSPGDIMNFPSLEEVFVDDCGSLTTLFPSSVAKNLGKLRTLELKCCAELVEIVEKDDDAMEHGTTEILEEVFVDDCGSLTTLFPSSVAKNLGKLRTLELKCCAELVEIVEKDDDAMEHGTTEMYMEE